MQDEIIRMTVAELGTRIAARELSPTDVVEAYLQRIETENPHLNAYVTVCAEAARSEARSLSDELVRRGARGPLHGIPVAVKDLQDTEGVRTTYGSSFFYDHLPSADAVPVARLRAAGAIVLGKANTHEVACGVTTDNPHYGTTHNPWRHGHIPGGSSGGSAAAVAGGLAPLATGSDTGGSIRLPAALCGCVGLKPTHGRVSLRGTFPMAASLDHVGPIARSAHDAALALGAMAGFDTHDPWSRRFADEDFTRLLGAPVRGQRIGIDRSYTPVPVEASVAANLERALVVLRDLGVEVVDVRLPPADQVTTFASILIAAETYVVHSERLQSRPEGFGADVRSMLESGRSFDGALVARAVHQREKLARGFERVLDEVDALIAPTAPLEAPPVGTNRVAIGGFETDLTLALASWTMMHNASRLPTVAVPTGLGGSGLPTSAQISTRPGEEARALALANALEAALWPPAQRWPR